MFAPSAVYRLTFLRVFFVAKLTRVHVFVHEQIKF